jgi:ABC-type transport system substrate-binding protein
MVSLRFPTAAVPRLPPTPGSKGVTIAATLAAAAAAAVAAASLTLTAKSTGRPVPHPAPSAPLWASLSLTDGAAPSSVEPRTGVAFPTETSAGRRLLGVGLRKTSVLGLKSIDVYAFGNPLKLTPLIFLHRKTSAIFLHRKTSAVVKKGIFEMSLCVGVYADGNELKQQLEEKYQKFSASEVKEIAELINDVLEHDIRMTVKLQIVYGRLSIRSVRSAFEKSVGNRLQKFGGQDTKELLQR